MKYFDDSVQPIKMRVFAFNDLEINRGHASNFVRHWYTFQLHVRKSVLANRHLEKDGKFFSVHEHFRYRFFEILKQ